MNKNNSLKETIEEVLEKSMFASRWFIASKTKNKY